MNKTTLPGRSIGRILGSFRKELAWVLIFGFFSNLLILTPTIYMLQVFDRVFTSGSQYTLAAVSLLAIVFFLVMGFADWARSRLLVRAGSRFDELAQPEVFRASFDAQLRGARGASTQPIGDLMQLRQFLTGNGVFAFVDTPWVAVYTAVLFLIHPWLGWLAVVFVVLNLVLALVGNRLLVSRHEDAQKAQLAGEVGGVVQLRQFLTGNGVFAFVDTPWVAVYTAVLFLIHPWLGWLAVVFVVLNLVLALVGNRLLVSRHEDAQKAQLDNTTYLAGKLRNAETVQALGMQGHLQRHWIDVHDVAVQRGLHAAEGTHRMQSLIKFMQYTQQSLVLALGALLAIDGQITAGAMIASNALLGNALRPIGTLVASWKPFLDSRAAYRRLEQLLAEHPKRDTSNSPRVVLGQITLRGLQATADKRKDPILKGLDVEFVPGEVVAIAGPSGAGKSTLARCLLGIWPGTAGQVLLDGVPIEQWDRESLGSLLGYLPQDIELFEGTIADNIARFEPDREDAVIQAAQRAGIHDMILRLPKGYDTPMGEAGSMLSGGQRQRIGLARAMLGDPQVVVLDEPNANLDDAGEAALIRAVQDLRSRGKTVFMIVHQKHLLAVADRLLVLDNGRIAQLAKVQQVAPAAPATIAS